MAGFAHIGEQILLGEGEEDIKEGDALQTDVIQDEDDGEYGQIRPKSLNAPYTPSRQERVEHDLTHCPYRSWCEHCVHGKGVSHGHFQRQPDEESSIPLIGVDYAFVIKTDADQKQLSEVTTMVAKDRRSKCVFPVPVPQKGVDPEEYSTRQLLRVLDYLGYSEVILKCDQESALGKVIGNVKMHRGPGTQTGVENSPVGDSKSNGLVERANRTVEGQIRTMVSCLEHKLGKPIDASCSVFPWLIAYSGVLLNRFTVGKDGKTPHERLRGRKSRKQLLEFGESVHFMALNALDKPNADMRYQDGIYLGIRLGSDEYLVGTAGGVFKARSIRRKPMEHRWDHAQVTSIMGTPWKPYAFTEDDKLRIDIPGVQDPQREVERREPEENQAPKRFRIERKDLEKLGYTPGCPGCYNARHSRNHRSHTQHCRERIKKAMSEDPMLSKRVEDATLRENRWIEEEHDRSVAKRAQSGEQVKEAEVSVTPTASPFLAEAQAERTAQTPIPERPVTDKDEFDTSDFYMEVNDQVASDIVDNTMSEISQLTDTIDDGTQLINLVNEAMKKMMQTYRPTDDEPDHDIIGVMRAAHQLGDPHVSEIYSPTRVTSLASKYGMRPGFALDLTVLDTDGEPWNFDDPEKRRRAMDLLTQTKPKLLIGSPMCRAFSALQGLNRAKMGEVKWKSMVEHGLTHLRFVCELYRIQAESGRYYLHEHPAGATSWRVPEVQSLCDDSDAHVVVADLCMFGMSSRDHLGEGLAKKPTKFLTNSAHIARWLTVKCSGQHRHVTLIGGRAKVCEIYPRKLCEAMLRGLSDQLTADGLRNPDGTLFNTGHDEWESCLNSVGDQPGNWEQFYDDISGLPLRTDLVRKARQEEMDIFHQFPVYKKVPLADAFH